VDGASASRILALQEDNARPDSGEHRYDDLNAFLHRPAELAADLLGEGITAMKIWPFAWRPRDERLLYLEQ
jgi:hypothetical protein